MLEERRDILDGDDCSFVRYLRPRSSGGQVIRLIIARFHGLSNSDVHSNFPSNHNLDNDRPHVDYLLSNPRGT